MDPHFFVIAMSLALCGFLLLGFPVAFTLSGVALLFALFSYAFGAFDISFVRAMPQRIFGTAMWNEVLLAVPLFIFMGVMLERSKVAEELLERQRESLSPEFRKQIHHYFRIIGERARTRKVAPQKK